MKPVASGVAAFAAALALSSPANAKTVRFALLIGNNDGHDPDRRLRYAEQDAERLGRVLRELGGFEPGRTRLLVGASAEEVREALRTMEAQISTVRHEEGDRSFFLLYYSGHADGEHLELGDGRLSFMEIKQHLRSSSADLRLAFVDACRSGVIIRAKGATTTPALTIETSDELASSGFAIVASSAANELSQESTALRGSVFTHHLISSLRGAADASNDGKVTLAEAYAYVQQHTVAETSVTPWGTQHPHHEFDLQGRGSIILTKRSPRRTAVLRVHAAEASRLVVLDNGGEEMIAEASLWPDRPGRLMLGPGTYQVYLSTATRLRRAETTLAPGVEVEMEGADFRVVRAPDSRAKEGLFQVELAHEVTASMLLRRMPLEASTLAYGGALTYRFEPTASIYPLVRGHWATSPATTDFRGYHEVGILVGFGLRVSETPWFSVRAELSAGYEHLFQASEGGSPRNSAGLSYIGAVVFERTFGLFVLDLAGAGGGRLFRVQAPSAIAHRPDLQVLLGLGLRWSS